MSRIDKYLEEIQLQEGTAGWTTAAIIALVFGASIAHDRIKERKLRRLIDKHKAEIDKIVDVNVRKTLPKIYKIGERLYKELKTKYKWAYKYFDNHDQIETLVGRQQVKEYEINIKSQLRWMVKSMIAYKKIEPKSFVLFANEFGIEPTNDHVGDNLQRDGKEFDSKWSMMEQNPKYKKWEKVYLASIERIRQADMEAFAILKGTINQIAQVLKSYLSKEAQKELQKRGK